MFDVIVIGAGVSGAFVTRNLSRYELNVICLEAKNDVGDVSSMANSAIVHSGYDPLPGTNKAKFNVLGNKMYPSICKELDVSFSPIGSLTLGFNEENMATLASLKERAKENGVEAILLDKEETLKLEPNISSSLMGSLLCPSAGIINPFTLVAHCFENALDNGAKLELNCKVTSIKKEDGIYVLETTKGIYKAKMVINCAGLYADKIASMVEEIDWHISPRKGEYYVLDHFKPDFVNHVLFPLPTEKGKGILVTRTTSNNYLVGPSSEFVDSKDDTSTDSLTLGEVKKSAISMVPSIPFYEQIRTFSGLRATPSTHDFIISYSKNDKYFINVAGIESPGLASSPAIGKYVVEELIKPVLNMKEKANYNPNIKPYIKMNNLSIEERNGIIKKNPKYGQMICNCEKISLGEIEDVLSRSLPCLTIKAVKKRTRAGFGKCQGGFCQSKVLFLLADKLNISPLEVNYDGEGSNILKEESK